MKRIILQHSHSSFKYRNIDFNNKYFFSFKGYLANYHQSVIELIGFFLSSVYSYLYVCFQG